VKLRKRIFFLQHRNLGAEKFGENGPFCRDKLRLLWGNFGGVSKER